MSVLKLRLLGGFEARTASGQQIPLPSRKSAALLAFLALHADRPVSRDRLANLLWGTKSQAAARANLRQALTTLRKALPEECLAVFSSNGDTLTAHGAAMDLDVAAFDRFEQSAANGARNDPAAVYPGALLDGLNIDEPAFDEWLREARDDLHQRALHAFSSALDRLEAEGATARAIDVAKDLLCLEPLDESVHRALIRLYCQAGRNGLALAQYEACAGLLRRELDVSPEPATTALYEAVKLKRRGNGSGDPIDDVDRESMGGNPDPEARATTNTACAPASEDAGAGSIFSGLFGHGPRVSIMGAVVVMLLAVGVVGWASRAPLIDADHLRNPIAQLPGGPSIAVLPLENLTKDTSQDYFIDGLTEEIIDTLAHFPDLSVIARNSSFRYRGGAVDVRDIGRELDAQFLLTGSVRRETDHIRISAQLVEAETRSYLWSETYNRALTAESMFAIQYEIAAAIASALADNYGVVRQRGLAIARGRPPEHLSSYECVLLGLDWLRGVPRETYGKVRECLERSVETDPDYARAWSILATVSVYGHNLGYDTRPESLDRVHEAAHRAVALAPGYYDAHWRSAWAHFFIGDLDAFNAGVDRAIELAPRGASFLGYAGLFVAYAGDWEKGLALIDEATTHDPFYPSGYHFGHFFDHYRKGEYEAALEMAQKTDMPKYVWAQALIAAAYGQLGKADQARETVKRILELDPEFETTARAKRWIWFRYQEDLLDDFMDGLRKAGLDIP